MSKSMLQLHRTDLESSDDYKVTKMRFPKKDQKETIIYNSRITVENIPAKAYEYIVNGKSAIEWIMERYQITTHKESGIRNDPNDWATEVGNSMLDTRCWMFDYKYSDFNLPTSSFTLFSCISKSKSLASKNQKSH